MGESFLITRYVKSCVAFLVCSLHGLLYFCLFFLPYLGSTLTPLTPIPVSDAGKSMLHTSSLSVLGDQQFQTVGSGSISSVQDYYNGSYPQYGTPYGGYSYGSPGSLVTK